jgi:hypothetical protein
MSTETLRAAHLLRNAFTNEEAKAAKDSVARISMLQDRFIYYLRVRKKISYLTFLLG